MQSMSLSDLTVGLIVQLVESARYEFVRDLTVGLIAQLVESAGYEFVRPYSWSHSSVGRVCKV